jgi:hypothetical protein
MNEVEHEDGLQLDTPNNGHGGRIGCGVLARRGVG